MSSLNLRAGIDAVARAFNIDLGSSDPEKGSYLVRFIQAGVGAVSRTVRDKLREVKTLGDYGAVGDGVTNDTAAVQAAFDDLSAGSNLFENSGKTYLVDTLVILNKSKANVNLQCILKATGTGGLTVKGCTNSDIHVKHILKGTGAEPADYGALTGTGLKVSSSSNCDVTVGRLEGFKDGINIIDEEGSGVYFCRIKWSSIKYCVNPLTWAVLDGVVGFVNGNTFFGGDLRGSASAIRTIKGSLQVDPFNGNTCYSTHIEKAVNAIDLDFAVNNGFFGVRIEGGVGAVTGRYVKTTATCERNNYALTSVPLDRLEVLGKSETFSGAVMDTGSGVSYGTNLRSTFEGNQLVVDAARDSGSIATVSNGVPVQTIVQNADVGTVTAVDKGIVALKFLSSAGSKKLRYPSDEFIKADNVDVALPYNVGVVEVSSATAAVKLKIKATEIRPGKRFLVYVTAYTNTISVRDEADTYNVTTWINSSGLWEVFGFTGGQMVAYKVA